MALSITESLRGQVIRRALTDGNVLALETETQRFRIAWEHGEPKLVGIDAIVVLPEVALGGTVNAG